MTTTTLVQPPDLHNLFDDTGPVLTHWRDAAITDVPAYQMWAGNIATSESAYIADGYILLRRDVVPTQVLALLETPPDGLLSRREVNREFIGQHIVTARTPAVFAGYAGRTDHDHRCVVYLAKQGRIYQPGLFQTGYHNLFLESIEDTDAISLTSKKVSPTLTATVLAAWRNDEVIAAVMGVAFFSQWRPIFDTFIQEWEAREEAQR